MGLVPYLCDLRRLGALGAIHRRVGLSRRRRLLPQFVVDDIGGELVESDLAPELLIVGFS